MYVRKSHRVASSSVTITSGTTYELTTLTIFLRVVGVSQALSVDDSVSSELFPLVSFLNGWRETLMSAIMPNGSADTLNGHHFIAARQDDLRKSDRSPLYQPCWQLFCVAHQLSADCASRQHT